MVWLDQSTCMCIPMLWYIYCYCHFLRIYKNSVCTAFRHCVKACPKISLLSPLSMLQQKSQELGVQMAVCRQERMYKDYMHKSPHPYFLFKAHYHFPVISEEFYQVFISYDSQMLVLRPHPNHSKSLQHSHYIAQKQYLLFILIPFTHTINVCLQVSRERWVLWMKMVQRQVLLYSMLHVLFLSIGVLMH